MPVCKGCGAEILWIKTEKNKAMPVDAKPEKRLTLHLDIHQDLCGRLEDTYMPHWATCPNATDFKG